MSLLEQELLALPEHLSSPPVFSGVRVTRFLFVLLVIVLSVLLRYTDSDYPFGNLTQKIADNNSGNVISKYSFLHINHTIRAGYMYGPYLRGLNLYAMLQFNSVKQSLLFWLQQLKLFISFDMCNDMIVFRHLNS